MVTHKNIVYKSTDKKQLFLDLYLPDSQEFDVFVFFHGGGLTGGSKEGAAVFAEYLTARGVAVVAVQYSLYPDAEYPDFIRDAAISVKWTQDNIGRYGEAKRVFVGGSSAGGYLSMMLCFDGRWYGECGVDPKSIAGYFHDAGQPTAHFTVLEKRGVDPRKVIVDDSAPLYHVGEADGYPPMRFTVSDNDMANRFEQTMLMISTLRHFGYDQGKISKTIAGGPHCGYFGEKTKAGESRYGEMILDFITSVK